MASKFRNSGQTCVCANRIYVQSGVYDEFVKQFAKAVSQIAVGNGLSEEVTQGPMINERAIQKTLELVHDAIQKGARVEVGGGVDERLGGNFFEPTVLTGVTSDMDVCRTEIFGPLAPVQKFETEEEAVRLANDTRAGSLSFSLSLSLILSLIPSLPLSLPLSRFDIWRSYFIYPLTHSYLHTFIHTRTPISLMSLISLRSDGICIHQGPWACVENGGGPRIRDGGCQRRYVLILSFLSLLSLSLHFFLSLIFLSRHHIVGSSAVWRDERERPWKGGLALWPGRLLRSEVRVHGGAWGDMRA